MAIRNIVIKGDPALRKVCRAVDVFDPRLHMLLEDMADTLVQSKGVGLAAPQVGVLRRVVVIDKGENDIVEMVNPLVIHREGEQVGMEGCLSVPGKYGIVKRPQKVVASYLDRHGHPKEIEAEDLIARAICHECDHLDGKLYTDNVIRMLTQEEIDALEREKGDA